MQMEMSVVRKALCPIFVVASIFGVQVFEYHIIPLNFLHYALTWTIYTLAFVALNTCTEFSTAFHLEYRYEVGYNVLTSFISTGLILHHRKKFHKCLESLAIINTSLGQFGIPDEYDKLRMWTWRVVCIWFFMMVVSIAMDMKWMCLEVGRFAGTMGSFVMNYPCSIILLNYVIICLLLWYTNSRFDRINRYVGALTEQRNSKTNWLSDWRCGVYDLVNPIIIKKHERDIWIMMHLHESLCKVSRELNTIFGVQLALETGTYFMYVFSITIYTCLSFLPLLSKMKITGRDTSNLLVILILGWIKCGFYVVRLVYINHMCESVSTKANSTRMILHNFLSCVNAAELREEILQFILHMVNRPLKFHAAGMFHYGYSFIYTSVGAMTTLLVIILQSTSVTDEIYGFISSQYMGNSTFRTN